MAKPCSYSLLLLQVKFKQYTVKEVLDIVKSDLSLYGSLLEELEKIELDEESVFGENILTLDFFVDVVSELNCCDDNLSRLRLLSSSNVSAGTIMSVMDYSRGKNVYCSYDTKNFLDELCRDIYVGDYDYNKSTYKDTYVRWLSVLNLNYNIDDLYIDNNCDRFARYCSSEPSSINPFRQQCIAEYKKLYDSLPSKFKLRNGLRFTKPGVYDIKCKNKLVEGIDLFDCVWCDYTERNSFNIKPDSIYMIPISELIDFDTVDNFDELKRPVCFNSMTMLTSVCMSRDFFAKDYLYAFMFTINSDEYRSDDSKIIGPIYSVVPDKYKIGCFDLIDVFNYKELILEMLRYTISSLLYRDIRYSEFSKCLPRLLDYVSTPQPYEPWSDEYIEQRWGVAVLNYIRCSTSSGLPYCVQELLFAYGEFNQSGILKYCKIPNYVFEHVKYVLGS